MIVKLLILSVVMFFLNLFFCFKTLNKREMKLQLRLEINKALYLKNPENTDLGKRIIKHSIILIHQTGFEAFTFKKLAQEIGTTEAGVYRYFENKHKLLIYLITWYWGWLEFQIKFQTNNIAEPAIKLKKIISILSIPVEDDLATDYVNESLLHKICIDEGAKTYLTKQVEENNKQQFFKPYKDVCALVSEIISEQNPSYKYPKTLASTIIEVAHLQNFFKDHLPSLTDVNNDKTTNLVEDFLNDLVTRVLQS